jgi:hypothetical protein
LFFAE